MIEVPEKESTQDLIQMQRFDPIKFKLLLSKKPLKSKLDALKAVDSNPLSYLSKVE